ncbi:MAG: nucleotidyltransferase family protein [Caldilineales bacterium]
MTTSISLSQEVLAEYSQRHHIRYLAVYGSALRADFDQHSDIDILVEFEPDHIPGLFAIARMERELSALLGGRKVDLRTPQDLSHYFRHRVLQEAKAQYVQR